MRLIQEEWAHHRLHRPAIGVVYYSSPSSPHSQKFSIVPSSCSAFLEKLRKIIANPRPRHLFDCFLPSHQPSHCYVADLLLIGILLLLLHTPSHTRDTHASLSFAEKPKKTSLFLPFFNYNSTTLTQSIMFSSNKAAQVAAISATLAASLVSAVTINTPSA